MLGVLKLLSALQTISLLTLNAGLWGDLLKSEGLCPNQTSRGPLKGSSAECRSG